MATGIHRLMIMAMMTAAAVSGFAQTPYVQSSDEKTRPARYADRKVIDLVQDEESTFTEEDLDENGELISAFDDMWADTLEAEAAPEPLKFLPVAPLPSILFLPVVYDEFRHLDSVAPFDPEPFVAAQSADFDWLKI